MHLATSFVDGLVFGPIFLLRLDEAQLFTSLNASANLLMLLPSFAVCARRFHDLDRTGWWQLLNFTRIGTLVVFVWFMFRGSAVPSRDAADRRSIKDLTTRCGCLPSTGR